jgi:signal transduction histidine kinase
MDIKQYLDQKQLVKDMTTEQLRPAIMSMLRNWEAQLNHLEANEPGSFNITRAEIREFVWLINELIHRANLTPAEARVWAHSARNIYENLASYLSALISDPTSGYESLVLGILPFVYDFVSQVEDICSSDNTVEVFRMLMTVRRSFPANEQVNVGCDVDNSRVAKKIGTVELGISRSLAIAILTDVVNNSIKYGKPNTKIDVELKAELTNNYLKVAVEDNGIGIPAERLMSVRESLSAARILRDTGKLETPVPYLGADNRIKVSKGEGLYSHVLSGVDIAVESIEDMGTTTTVYIPLKPTNTEA